MYSELYYWLLPAVFVSAAFVFFLLFFITAPYGKFERKGWGPEIQSKWAWIIMESPAVWGMIFMFLIDGAWQHPINWIFIIIWQSHYLQRSYVYPLINQSIKPFPVLLVLFAIIFNSINAYVNGFYLFVIQPYGPEWLMDIRFISGLGLFILGYSINKKSDRILRNIRKTSSNQYGMPVGGGFKWVSNPHYLGEIIEWIGWAILTWSVAGLSFLAFTIANLAPRALAHHKWYKSKFEGYPKERKILIPFIW